MRIFHQLRHFFQILSPLRLPVSPRPPVPMRLTGDLEDRESKESTSKLFDEGACNFFFDAPKLPEKPSYNDRRLAALSKEFGSYLFYCATLLAIFGAQLDVSAIKRAQQDGMFDQLAKARQSQSVDPKLSWTLCDAFRKKIGLSSPSREAE
ncbi:MAG: hypothetical protein L0Y72_03660 [Gemmataceae bacterium]|nr:hypothetical protein [Gemmataceae bacterium]